MFTATGHIRFVGTFLKTIAPIFRAHSCITWNVDRTPRMESRIWKVNRCELIDSERDGDLPKPAAFWRGTAKAVASVLGLCDESQEEEEHNGNVANTDELPCALL